MYTDSEKLACAKRELGLRERVYPRLVDAGKITAKLAARELDLMRAIVDDYEIKAAGERLL